MQWCMPNSTLYLLRMLDNAAPRAPIKAALCRGAGACSGACLTARRIYYACLITRRLARLLQLPLAGAQGACSGACLTAHCTAHCIYYACSISRRLARLLKPPFAEAQGHAVVHASAASRGYSRPMASRFGYAELWVPASSSTALPLTPAEVTVGSSECSGWAAPPFRKGGGL